MALSAGSRLGPYEIVAPLGAGGMGEVYRARDTRLGREVAIKVLPAALSSDSERLKRFEKEARSASALNHPNIVTVYDIGSQDGVSYLAMELVSGETLRTLVSGGPLPIKKLLSIAPQIAEGLAKAHEAGIVHRDLKPENVMVTKDGLVKILDFGLAKLTSPMSGSDEGSKLPTMTGTTPGVVVGTVGYMSPEQASGEAVDYRSDQFSFGSILYEMVTGRRAFQKKTAIDTLAAILNEEPEAIASLNPQAPAPLRWIVERCLSKDREDRYASTKDLARELKSVSDHLSEATLSGSVGAASGSAARKAWRAAAALLLVAVGVIAGRQLRGKTPSPPRFQQVTFQKANIHTATFGPDGQTIVYASRRADGVLELFQTRPGSRGSRALGITGAFVTSISAAGEMALVREGDNALVSASLGGGEPRTLAEGVGWASWAPDAKSLAVMRQPRGLLEFPMGHALLEGAYERVVVSPRGDRVAYKDGENRLGVVDREKVKTPLAADAVEFAWSPSGEEVWFTRIVNSSTHLFAVALSGRERLITSLPGDFTLYSVSRDGRVLFERGALQWRVVGKFAGDEHERGYNWLDATSAQSLSPDGKTLLFVEREPGLNDATTYLRKTDGSAAAPLFEGWCMEMSPDGRWAVCRADLRAPNLQLVSTTGERRDLPNGGLHFAMQCTPGWLPDGRRIVFTANAPGRPRRIYVQSVDGSPPKAISPEGAEAVFFGHAASPDGRFVVGEKDGLAGLYPVDGGSPVPIAGLLPGDRPIQWSADGKSLYLRREDAPLKIWIVSIASGERRLFQELRGADAWVGQGGWLWNVFITPDGQHYAATYQNFLADLFVLDGVK